MNIELPEADRDTLIIRQLLFDPMAGRGKIARLTGIPESTVQRRLKALRDSGVLTYQLLLASHNRYFQARAMISVNIDPCKLEDDNFNYHNQQEFTHFLRWELMHREEFAPIMADVVLERVEIVLGGHSDMVIFVSAIDIHALCNFVTMVLRKLNGVATTNTATIVSIAQNALERNERMRTNAFSSKEAI